MSRHPAPFAAALALLLPLTAASPAEASRFEPEPPLSVEVFDRHSGEVLPMYRHRGEWYVAGEPGHEYEIRLRNSGQGRILAVTSVDGVNVLTGRTAAADQRGYVIDAWSSASIDGWRKNLDEVAAFYFTRLKDSYAARTGRPDHVGVIGVAMFRERERVLPMAAPPPAPPPYAESMARERAATGSSVAGAAADSSHDKAEASRRESRLGTGHGERRDSRVTETAFERASDRPDAIVKIFYDSRSRLVAQGVIRAPRVAQQKPNPFPDGGFVPDP